MSYENPRLPEHVNVARESVPMEFLRLIAGLAIVLAIAVLVLQTSGGWLARQIPYRLEQRWVGERILGLPEATIDQGDNATRDYLQGLADTLANGMDLPRDMQPRLHLMDMPTPNAFATLGGHIVVTRGLYERMPSENALAMVLAHELAHLRARDPIGVLGGSFAASLLLALLGGDASSLAPQIAQLAVLGYSRHVEQQADARALDALLRHYGHAGGAAALFEVLAKAHDTGTKLPSLLSTHPADDARIARIHAAARGWEPRTQPLRDLPRATPAPSPAPTTP